MSKNKEFTIGCIVEDRKGNIGTVRFIGAANSMQSNLIGVELNEAVGNCSGDNLGIKHFECPAMHGMFYRKSQLKILNQEENQSKAKKTKGKAKTTKSRKSENIKEKSKNLKDSKEKSKNVKDSKEKKANFDLVKPVSKSPTNEVKKSPVNSIKNQRSKRSFSVSKKQEIRKPQYHLQKNETFAQEQDTEKISRRLSGGSLKKKTVTPQPLDDSSIEKNLQEVQDMKKQLIDLLTKTKSVLELEDSKTKNQIDDSEQLKLDLEKIQKEIDQEKILSQDIQEKINESEKKIEDKFLRFKFIQKEIQKINLNNPNFLYQEEIHEILNNEKYLNENDGFELEQIQNNSNTLILKLIFISRILKSSGNLIEGSEKEGKEMVERIELIQNNF
ncbi:dynactin subunit 1 [Anaeramoeba ignava]|uniref:Dynactin subunit 1 n=1 Tax=Anaeramoeba ignava TaxID=1746090 RepID=A0A9Q0L6I3_ANAIG|nr:dynactin subunit 1 [Anaeramoeba ignava]